MEPCVTALFSCPRGGSHSGQILCHISDPRLFPKIPEKERKGAPRNRGPSEHIFRPSGLKDRAWGETHVTEKEAET